MDKRSAHRPYVQHKAYRTFHKHQDDRWLWFASGWLWSAAVVGLLFLAGAKHLDAVKHSQLIDPTRVLLKSATYEKQIDAKTHITEIKVEHSAPRRGSDTRVPTQTPVKEVYTAPHNEITAYIDQVWGKDADVGKRIAQAESSLNPSAIHRNNNGTKDRGVFQINSIHKNVDDSCAFDYRCNIRMGYRLYLDQGSAPWNSSKHNWSK
jgi:hypothetical protein